MAEESSPPVAPSPFAYQILNSAEVAIGKTVERVIKLENAIVFLYNDKSALVVATMSYDHGESNEAAAIEEERLFDYFEFKNLANSGLLTQLYVLQQIGNEAGITIVPAAEGENTFRIAPSTNVVI
jgi:hypothetical protein